MFFTPKGDAIVTLEDGASVARQWRQFDNDRSLPSPQMMNAECPEGVGHFNFPGLC